MLKYVLIGFLIMFVLAGIVTLVQRFKTFFIILAILIVVGLVVFLYFRIKKARKAKDSAFEPVATQPKASNEPEQPQKPESVVNKYEVTGVVFYLNNLLSMMEPNYLWEYKKQDLIDTCNYDVPIYKNVVNAAHLSLTHEPDNPHDPNAVMVLLNDKLVGYIAAKDCQHVLNIIDNDLMVSMTCEIRGGKYKILNEDYDADRDKSTYSMETGEDEYGITIYIREKVMK